MGEAQRTEKLVNPLQIALNGSTNKLSMKSVDGQILQYAISNNKVVRKVKKTSESPQTNVASRSNQNLPVSIDLKR